MNLINCVEQMHVSLASVKVFAAATTHACWAADAVDLLSVTISSKPDSFSPVSIPQHSRAFRRDFTSHLSLGTACLNARHHVAFVIVCHTAVQAAQ